MIWKLLKRDNFLEGIIEKIIVSTKDKQTHSLEIQFVSPFVGDELIWNEVGKTKKGYTINDGEKNLLTNLISKIRTTKKKVIKVTLLNNKNYLIGNSKSIWLRWSNLPPTHRFITSLKR